MEDVDLLGLLGLEDFRIIDLRQAEDGVVIRVESASPPDGCQRCGVVGDLIVKERPVVRVRDLSISGRPAWLWWRKHRWSCRSCHRTFTQSHPATDERQRVSSRLRRHLGNRARSGAAHAEVARDEHVSRYHVGQGARFNRPPSPWWLAELERWPRWISLDEAAHRRNRELPTVISAPEQRRVLDVIPGRSKQAVQQWLQALPADVAANIKVVSIDPYDAYRRAIQAELPQAVIVCDPFHLVRGAGTAMDSVRRDRQRIARTSGRLAHGARQSGKQHNWQPELYRSRRRLLSAHERLDPSNAAKLQALFALDPEMRRAWALKEDFRTIYHLRTRVEAEQRLEAFLTAAEASGFPAFVSFAHGLRKWRGEFLAYFDQRATNGYAEGITNKIKVIKRRAYGLPTFDGFRDRILLCCG
jgi:transposase